MSVLIGSFLLSGCSIKYLNDEKKTVVVGFLQYVENQNSSKLYQTRHKYFGIHIDLKKGFSSTIGFKDETRTIIREDK